MCLFSPKEAVSSGRLVLVNGHQPNHLLHSDVYSFTFLSVVVIALASREVLVVYLASLNGWTNEPETDLFNHWAFSSSSWFSNKTSKRTWTSCCLTIAWSMITTTFFFSLDLFPSNPNITWVALCWSTNNEAEKLGEKKKKKKWNESMTLEIRSKKWFLPQNLAWRLHRAYF